MKNERVTGTKVFGIIVNDRLSASDHVSNLLSSCSGLLHALRVSRSRGIPAESLYDVYSSNRRSLRTFHSVRQHGLLGIAEFAGLEIAGLEIDDWNLEDWNLTDWKLTH